MKFDYYAWQKAGRPASPAEHSTAYADRAHWKFNTPEDYVAIKSSFGKWVIAAKGQYTFEVPKEFFKLEITQQEFMERSEELVNLHESFSDIVVSGNTEEMNSAIETIRTKNFELQVASIIE
ncbi:head protein [Enterobacter phage vB_VIPECLOM01]|nr:hypothetical protein [Enterobacter phage fGh-Ecl01]USL85996.1 hypothetical protein [Enterobacter phage fGh-Ecl04]WFG78459.1 head protein [Enterobacter phage vB_VIPECLOM01]WFG78747.1 head protein [Enterobacter phage vB_VIPECLUMC02]